MNGLLKMVVAVVVMFILIIITMALIERAVGQTCVQRDVRLEEYALKFSEKPVARGKLPDGKTFIEILVSPEGSWTLLVTDPESGCVWVRAFGSGWDMLGFGEDI